MPVSISFKILVKVFAPDGDTDRTHDRSVCQVQWRHEALGDHRSVGLGPSRQRALRSRHHRLPTAAEDRLRALALGSSRVELSDSLHAVVILAQPRSMIVDFLELTGMGNLEARELIPELSE